MTKFKKWDAETHPEVKLSDDYNEIVDFLRSLYLDGAVLNKEHSNQLEYDFKKATRKVYSDASIEYTHDLIYVRSQKKLFGTCRYQDKVRVYSFDPEAEIFESLTDTEFFGGDSIVHLNGYLYVVAKRVSNNNGVILRTTPSLSSFTVVYEKNEAFKWPGDMVTDGTNIYTGWGSETQQTLIVKLNATTLEATEMRCPYVNRNPHSMSYDGDNLWICTGDAGLEDPIILKVDTSNMTYTQYTLTGLGTAAITDDHLNIGSKIIFAAERSSDNIIIFDKDDGSYFAFTPPYCHAKCDGIFYALGKIWAVYQSGYLVSIDPQTFTMITYRDILGDIYLTELATDGVLLWVTTYASPSQLIRLSPLHPMKIKSDFTIFKSDNTFRKNNIPTNPSDVLQHSLDAERSTSSMTPVKVKEITFNERVSGAKIYIECKCDPYDIYNVDVYKNGSAHSEFSTIIGDEGTYTPKTQECSEKFADVGDKIQIYLSVLLGSGTAYIRNFRIKYSYEPNRDATINLD